MRAHLLVALAVWAGAAAPGAEIRQSTAGLTLDGRLNDPFWQAAAAGKLAPVEAGVPQNLAGEIRFALRGGYLCLAARLPEPGGKVLARSIGWNPVWEKDALASPEVEDRVCFLLRYRSVDASERTVSVTVNPWGACRIEEGGRALNSVRVRRAAMVSEEGWSVEAAAPLLDLDLDWSRPQVEFSARQIRSRRPLAPEFRWSYPQNNGFEMLDLPPRGSVNWNLDAPEVRPPKLGNSDPPLAIGRVLRLPPMVADWSHPAWEKVPAFELARNEPAARAPRHRTWVKWVHDGRTLALLGRMEEPEPVVARAGGRDSAVTSDDHVAVYLAVTGSAFLEIAVNTVGAIRDSLGVGPHITRPQAEWNGKIDVQTDIRHGYWLARINIPLEEAAAALGETGVPRQWRILLVRHRAPRPGEAAEVSTLPAMGGASTFYGPVRYQAAELRDADPTQVARPSPPHQPAPAGDLARELAGRDWRVWPELYRRYHGVRTMVERHLRRKVEQAVLAERQAWEKVRTREDWERFRDARIRDLRESLGQFPPSRPPLAVRVTARHEGEGYRLENLVFQSRPGYWITGNLYWPATAAPPLPAILIVHSQHYPKTQGELHDMGELWARVGCAVLIMERPGYGERVETTPWYRQAYASRFTFTKQLFLVGESYSGWAAWDVIRSVDLLYERPEIDKSRIIVLGSVAGGAEPAAVAAALDKRITAIVPFNYDQGHVRVHGDTPGQIAGQFSPWLIAASVAPRKFVRAFEFGWEGAEEADYPNLWVDGMLRSQKVWGWYGAAEDLASSQAYGLIRLSMERVSHCFSIGPQQREGLYPILNRWFRIPFPSAKDRSILPDSELSVNPEREEARRQERLRRRPHADLLSIPPAVSAQLDRRPLHRLAFEMGERQLEEARRRRPNPPSGASQLREELRPLLAEIEPDRKPAAEMHWRRSLAAAEIEGWSVAVEEGIRVPALLLRPSGQGRTPVVIAVAQHGKERFLTDRAGELEALLRAGVAVCLPDVRATGESAPTPSRSDGGPYHWLAQTEFDLKRNLLGSRLRDLRTVLAWLRNLPGVDGGRLALWGDSFSPANPPALFLDELENEAGPEIQYRAEPLGAHLALLAALYEPDIRAVAARGGLVGYLSVLESNFTYVPIEDIVLGLLKVGDVADLAGALAPRPLRLEGFVTGRNVRASESELDRWWRPARLGYEKTGAASRLAVHSEPKPLAAWLIAQLK